MSNESIVLAVECVGSQSTLAQKLNVSPQFVSQLASGSRPVPATLAPKIEEATKGTVTRYDLRPDVFGSAPPAQQVA